MDAVGEEGAGAPPPATEVLDAFGTLSISEHGISRFFGPTGGSEVRRTNSIAVHGTCIDMTRIRFHRACYLYVPPAIILVKHV